MSLVSELRRRQVFRAAAWYGGVAWLAIEIANTVFPRFELPDWTVRAVIVAAVLGLPVALALAWWFDLSALGVRRETGAAAPPSQEHGGRERAPRAAPLWRIPSFWIAVTLGAGLAVSAQQAWRTMIQPAFGERPGLAVLPFANLSPDPENAYFADGLHEEILATLARASGLRVISRTSVEEYRDTKRNLREIADALDVTLILEGSVRRDGDDLRLTLQLIDGTTDEHLWAETYDRKFHNALALQRAVAEQVVAEIGAKLTPAEQRLIAKVPTTSPEAYERYLQALALFGKQDFEQTELRNVERLLSEAIERDPGFAIAYALRAKSRIRLYHNGWGSPGLADSAREDIERGLELHPDLPEALVARGLYRTWVTLDAANGLADLERALEIAPNDADTHHTAALALRRLGRFDEALARFEQAEQLAPGLIGYQYDRAFTLLGLKRYDEALRVWQSMMDRNPTQTWPLFGRYFLRFAATGDASGWRKDWDRVSLAMDQTDRAIIAYNMYTCGNDLPGLIDWYEHAPDAELAGSRDYILGVTHAALGNLAQARPHLEAAVAAAQEPKSADARIEGAVALELLGEHEAALRMIDDEVRRVPESLDAAAGPAVAMVRAWILIHGRERADEGYAELERLLDTFGVVPWFVKVNPLWRVLAGDARVQATIQAKLPK
jgi:TolB-like protein